MADVSREDLYNALRNADKAGDSEGARKLATYIQSLPNETVETVPVAAPKVEPLRAGLEGPREMLGIARRHPLTTSVGLIENGISGLTGGIGSIAEAVTGSDPGTYDFAYRPRTQAGQEIASLNGRAGASMGGMYDKAFGEGPLAATLKERLPQALSAAGTVAGLRVAVPETIATTRGAFNAVRNNLPTRAPMTAEQVVSKLDSQQSMGAASAAPSLLNVSPELRQAIVSSAQKTGGAINPEALARHVEADTLRVPVRLTEGQALQDPMIISREMNTRGSSGVMVDHMDDTNKRLGQNVQALRDEVGPDVFSTNAVEHGDTLIAAYKTKNEVAQANINAKYKALEDANGGTFPVDAPTLLKNASAQLHKKLIFEHAPKSVMGQLERMAKEGMTFEQFEAMRTNLATIQRTATDGLEKKAAGVIRSEMEKLPLSADAKGMKSLADEARSAAKAQFDALEADPAYEAAVSGSVSPDRFVSRFVINGDRDNLALMRQNLSADERALQTMGVATLDHLRDAARLNPHYEGNFAAASYNKALQALSPKMSSLVSPQIAEQMEKLGNVARYTTSQPRGSLVNNSNTAVAAAADYGAKAAEVAVNAQAGGLPVGTIGRRVIEAATRNRNARRAIAPGAGLDQLPSAKPQGLMQ